MDGLITGFLIGVIIAGVIIVLLIVGAVKKHRDKKRSK